MDIDETNLSKNYKSKTNFELLDLHKSGDLTVNAYNLLEAELSSRGIAIPYRHKEIAELSTRGIDIKSMSLEELWHAFNKNRANYKKEDWPLLKNEFYKRIGDRYRLNHNLPGSNDFQCFTDKCINYQGGYDNPDHDWATKYYCKIHGQFRVTKFGNLCDDYSFSDDSLLTHIFMCPRNDCGFCSQEFIENYDQLKKVKKCKKCSHEFYPQQSCFVATYVYGGINAYEVIWLKNFRDNILAKNSTGRFFVELYYDHISRILMRFIKKRVLLLRPLAKIAINSFIYFLSKKNITQGKI